MIGNLVDFIKCPVCIEGSMRLSVKNTFESCGQGFDLDDIDKLEDGMIEQYWVFDYLNCGATQRYNFRDIERLARKEISKRVLTLKAAGELGTTINTKVKYLVYCGVCNGYDSNGSCPQKVYDKCQLRRMPGGL